MSDIPLGWKKRSLASLAHFVNGYAFSPGDLSDEGLPVVRIRELLNPSIEPDRHSGVLPEYFRIDFGSLIFSWSATLAVVRWGGGPAYLNQHLFNVSPRSGVDISFLQHLLEFSIDELSASSHGTTMKHIKRSDIQLYAVSLPPLVEQRGIAEVIDAADEAIGASVERAEKLSLVKDGFVSGLLSGLQIEKKEPLMRAAEVSSGITLGGSLAGTGSKFPCITVANVQDGYLDLDKVKEILLPVSAAARYLLRSGDFLMTEGGDFDKLGRGTVWQGEIEDCLYQNHIFRIRCDQNRLLPKFLSIYSASWYGKNYFRLASKQSTNLASINSTQVKAFPVPMISLEEQRRIVSIVQAHDERIAAEKARLEKLRKLKAGLMDDLLTGRVRVDQLDALSV